MWLSGGEPGRESSLKRISKASGFDVVSSQTDDDRSYSVEKGSAGVADGVRMSDDAFVWSSERFILRLTQEGDFWAVICRSTSPLYGPDIVTYEAKHRLPTHAAWDVLTRVTRATRDDEEGVQAGSMAARWMKSMMWQKESFSVATS